MLKRMSISHRLMLFLPVSVIVLAAVVTFALTEQRRVLMEDRQEELKSLAQVARGVVEGWYEREKSGQLTEAQAQQGARDQLARLRYGHGDYYFIQRFDGVTMLHISRQVEGQNRISTRDPDGVPTVRLQIEAAQRGGGFIFYRNPRAGAIGTGAGNQQLLPKMSYTLPFEPWQWAIGTGIYIDDVDAIYYHLVGIYVVLVVALLLLAIAAAYFIARTIRKPLSVITERMGRLADGDLEIEVPFLDERHEMGRLARALEVFKRNRRRAEELTAAQQAEDAAKRRRQEKLERLFGEFHGRMARVITAVARAAEHVQANARRLASMAQESRTGLETVARAAIDTTGNVQAVAGAAEELSTAVGDVNGRIVKSTEVAKRAVAETERSNATMRGLVTAAQRIGKIVEVIQDIASQTNLLALNATIEAARAGDAGKGFAVVAGEVKLLANQTTKATEEIQGQVGAIQSETTRAVDAIGNIGKTVEEMSEIATAIASAMEQQGATTHDIARNISQAAERTREVSANVSSVGGAAETTSGAADELQNASDQLREQAAALENEMTSFLAEMRAA